MHFFRDSHVKRESEAYAHEEIEPLPWCSFHVHTRNECVKCSNQNLSTYLLIMPLKFTDRWIQLVKGNDLNAQVFANVPRKEKFKDKWNLKSMINTSTHLLVFSSALLRFDELA